MKRLINILLLMVAANGAMAQQKPVYERTRTDQVLSDRAIWSKAFMALPSGTTPSIPSYVPDSLKNKGLLYYKNSGSAKGLYLYNDSTSTWDALSSTNTVDTKINQLITGNTVWSGNNTFSNGLFINGASIYGDKFIMYDYSGGGIAGLMTYKSATDTSALTGTYLFGFDATKNYLIFGDRDGRRRILTTADSTVFATALATKQNNLTFGRGLINTSNTITLDTAKNYLFTNGLTLKRTTGAQVTLDNGTGKSYLTVDNNGGLTISPTTTPVAAPAGFPTALHLVGMNARNFGLVMDNFNASGAIVFGRRSQGTAESPTPILQQQAMLDVSGAGYGATGWGQAAGSFRIQAAQNYTDTNQGAQMTWYLTPLNTQAGEPRLRPVMQLTPDGGLTITDYYAKIGGLITPTNTGSKPFLKIYNSTSKDSTANAVDLTVKVDYTQKGTASSTNFLIDRTETSLGSGTHKFASFTVNSVEKFSVTNLGLVTGQRMFANSTAGSTAEDMGLIKNSAGTLGITNYNNATNMTSGSIIGHIAFNAYQNSTGPLGVARITSYYMGDGTTRTGDLGFSVQNNGGGYKELLRLGASAGSITLDGKILIPVGLNKAVGQATLSSGTVTVANTGVTANSLIFFSVPTVSGTRGTLTYTVTPGTSFTITSSSSTDNSTVNYQIIN